MQHRFPPPVSPTTLPSLRAPSWQRASISETRPVIRGVPPTSATQTAELIVGELEHRTRHQGPMAPDVAAHWVRSAARALHRAEKNGDKVDTAACVRWLGSTLYFALTGKAPFGPLPGLLSPARPPAASSLSPHPVSASLDTVISKCLAREGVDRFSSIGELCVALSSAAAGPTCDVEPAAA